ncbi:ABC-2 type transporter [Leucobacter sp. 7(1)]|uniref:ABC transporter permease n=1 Tax=Leucobacter sp. 7(1) TaxID=1255613 RepID=UPI00097E9DF7|nr:ABC transporter permease [Leucobacter sp. 7(1)]SJN10123.1 ABC-2 type transporter [Leucobacter sp. 7(1)]
MLAVIRKEFRELARDRRTLALLVVLPMLLLIIFGYAANFSVDRVAVVVGGEGGAALAEEVELRDADPAKIHIIRIDSTLDEDAAVRLLRDREADAVILGTAVSAEPITNRMRVFVDGSRLFTAQATQAAFVQLVGADARERARDAQADVAAARAAGERAEGNVTQFRVELTEYVESLVRSSETGSPAPAEPVPPEEVTFPELPELSIPSFDPDEFITMLFNPDLKTSWVMVPGLTGLILLFVGTMITSIGLVRERETGTLEQLAVMPLSPSAIIFGKVTPYFLLAILNMAAVTGLGVWLFAIPFAGSVLWFALAALAFLLVVLGVGVLISSASQSTGQAIQMAIMFVVPQVLLSGLIFPLEAMPAIIRSIGYALPLTWFREVSQGVMLRDAQIDSLWLPILILVGMAVVAFGAATVRMRRILTHGGAR